MVNGADNAVAASAASAAATADGAVGVASTAAASAATASAAADSAVGGVASSAADSAVGAAAAAADGATAASAAADGAATAAHNGADGHARPVTCLGEALAVLVPDHEGANYALTVGGAEVNVACSLAALGVPARWVGRLGDDHFGRVVLRTLAERGVDVSDVEIDPDRQTGLYVKEITPAASAAFEPVTRMRYYRAGSAACAMGPQWADTAALCDTPLLHISGITPALSESCAALIDAILARPSPRPGRIVSFDVNVRPALWSGRDPAVLLDLARRADLVFIGADEAEMLCGVGAPDRLRRLLPEPRTLVVKQGTDGAVGFEGAQRVHAPALPVQIAEATGAGDAFAAGFIAATVRGLSLRDRLRLGTFAAAGALRVRGDLGTMPTAEAVADFLAARAEPRSGLEAAPA